MSLLCMGLLCVAGAQAQTTFTSESATIHWEVGNEQAGTITGNVDGAIKSTKWKAGTGLTKSEAAYTTVSAGTLAEYNPNTGNPGNVADAMVEYTIKMAKGTTFTLSSVEYDAVKNGTDNATYSWSYTVDGTESTITTVAKEKILRNNNSNSATATLRHTETITAAGGQVVTVRFYISGFANGKKCAIGNLDIKGTVDGTPEVRAFTDFKVDFRTNPYTVVAPEAGLPSGVEVTVPSYNGNQHGAQGATTIVVPVDGPVMFTIGNCQYSHYMTVTDKDGNTLATVENNGSCENSVSSLPTTLYNSYTTYTYNVEEANTLTFTLNGYLPYFFAEACDFIESCDVTYYDTDGKTIIGTETVQGSSALAYKYGASDVTVPAGSAFRGWFTSATVAATKVAEGTSVDSDLSLYAKATEIEETAVGKIFTYDLTKPYFYEEDHELFNVSGGKYHSNHGWVFGNGGTFTVDVAGTAQVVVGLCAYAADAPIEVTDANGNVVGTIASAKVDADGGTSAINYTGEATKLTFKLGGTAYIHKVIVYNVESIPTKDAATGYYVVPANDGAGFILALNSANSEGTEESPAKIFLPNGLYDLGNTCLTSVASNVSIIGESQDGVKIKNAPDEEGIGITATLLFSGSNIYLQDLALNCSAENCATPSASRCVTIQDKGTKNICKNVSLLSGQDTYYSNGAATQKAFFDNCYITGTVDFLCGGGDVVFNNTTLYINSRSSANVVAAPNTDATTQWGYLMLNCTIDGAADQANKYNFCRPWNGSPAATWINTVCKLLPSAKAFTNMTNGLVLRFHEYNTTDANGNAITGHVLDDCKGASADALYLTAEEAANYTIDNVLGEWAATAQAAIAQAAVTEATMEGNTITITGDAPAYLIEKDGEFLALTTENTYDVSASSTEGTTLSITADPVYTVRAANAKGGFGEAAVVVVATGINEVNAEGAAAEDGKFVENGKVVIVKNGKKFTAAGAEM